MQSKTNWSTVKYKFTKFIQIFMSKRPYPGIRIRNDYSGSYLAKKLRISPGPDT